ncbi:MAG TPA: 4-(cytidine 5'-diphospho)-2-C-methyl-D-erythritol kinase [Ktedonobacteraceae bacterium]|nr:4-(cytidine 5'-diphospho)-2-C-methyl-D-erythritol kinase [Ktedonobacteraceae bacterium]
MSHLQHATQRTYTTDKMCFVKSYAKINLTLDVLGRRSDGYHELATVMQTIDLYDTICLSTTDDDCVRLFCTRPELMTNDNLAVRAAQAVRQRLGLRQGIDIELHKHIPVAAGLGGGSSNAAAVLLALQRWWQLPLSSTDMLTIAASLGSDVPFFLSGGLALCEGRGERVTPLSPHWPMSMRWLLLLKPAIGISTAAVFRNLPASDYNDGSRSRQACMALQAKSALRPEDLHNSLERGVLEQYPVVAQAREAMLQAGASHVRLSGSGPTLFAPFSELVCAAQAQQLLGAQGYEVYLSRAIFPDGVLASFF